MATLPLQMKVRMAKREHSMSHYLWHELGNTWEKLTEEQKNAVRAIDQFRRR